MTIKKINPATLYDSAAFGLSQAAMDTDSGLIFYIRPGRLGQQLSGQE